MKYLELFIDGFELFVGLYSVLYILTYLALGVLSYDASKKYFYTKNYLSSKIVAKTNHTLGVSIIAPAYNEANTIVDNVKSHLLQEYPKFEVIIVNDGSKDNTLEKLIKEFELVKVNFYYIEHIKTQPVRGHYKSTNPLYAKLLVVDKENGKSKADASNAGINSARYSLFLCTDVDCILRKDAITELTKPFIESTTKVIATGGTLRISNSCEFKEGMLYKSHYPDNWLARFQELEYMRSFIFGRMAWSNINCLMLVSGGLGMFDKEIAIKAGGYWGKSLGEDLELITRMRKHMHDTKQKYRIIYVPETLCWTEVPDSLEQFLTQRKRWARGLIQTLNLHKKMLFNPKYGRTGVIGLPYFVFFEFGVPIIEILGLIVLLLDYYFFDINYEFLFIVTLFVYCFYVTLTLSTVLLDQFIRKQYSNIKELFTLICMIFLEPLIYHPLNLYASLKGFYLFFMNKEHKWGTMVRKGFVQKKD
jgi:cellulose synthase/poly-beta-1,6-N-acetylglucosamine synthase-like glycosyltransferase